MRNEKGKRENIIEVKEDIMRNEKRERGGSEMEKIFWKKIAALVVEMRPVYVKEMARLDKQLAKLKARYEKVRSVGVENYTKADIENLRILRKKITNSEKRFFALNWEWKRFQNGIISDKGILADKRRVYYKQG